VVPNTDGIRGRLLTLDYTDEEVSAILLTRPRRVESARPAPPSAVALDANALIAQVLLRERKRKRRVEVPRMDMLLRFEEEHERRVRSLRRQFFVLLGVLTVVYSVGLAVGLSVKPSRSLRPAVTSARNFVRDAAVRIPSAVSTLMRL
jgi:hypothetical protein